MPTKPKQESAYRVDGHATVCVDEYQVPLLIFSFVLHICALKTSHMCDKSFNFATNKNEAETNKQFYRLVDECVGSVRRRFVIRNVIVVAIAMRTPFTHCNQNHTADIAKRAAIYTFSMHRMN